MASSASLILVSTFFGIQVPFTGTAATDAEVAEIRQVCAKELDHTFDLTIASENSRLGSQVYVRSPAADEKRFREAYDEDLNGSKSFVEENLEFHTRANAFPRFDPSNALQQGLIASVCVDQARLKQLKRKP